MIISEKALNSNGNNVEQAMEYLLAHAGDAPAAPAEASATLTLSPNVKTDESLTGKDEEGAATAKSIKCEDCGRLFRTQVEVEFHAAKSGHLNFSE